MDTYAYEVSIFSSLSATICTRCSRGIISAFKIPNKAQTFLEPPITKKKTPSRKRIISVRVVPGGKL